MSNTDKIDWWTQVVQLHDEIHAGKDPDMDDLAKFIGYDQDESIGMIMRQNYVHELYGALVSKQDRCDFLKRLAEYGVQRSSDELTKINEIDDAEMSRLTREFNDRPDAFVERMAKLERFVETYSSKHNTALNEWRAHLSQCRMQARQNELFYGRLKDLAGQIGLPLEPLVQPKGEGPDAPGIYGNAA